MAKFGGAALKVTQTFFYTLCFLCAGIILGIYSYFLSVQADRNASIPQWQKAVEGISGIAVVYSIFAVVLTCCLGGKIFFAFLGIVMDLLLTAGLLAIAVMTRDGAQKCTGSNVDSPLGSGDASAHGSFGKNGFGTGNGENVTYASSIGFACKLNKVVFAVAIIGAFLFLISAIMQLWLARHHQKEKRFGPSPSNNYTKGSGNKWFRRKRSPKTTHAAYQKDAELGAVGAGGLAAGHHADFRPSHETGTTVGAPTGTFTDHKYETQPTIPTTGGYHTGPTGTSVNPYGYDNAHTAPHTVPHNTAGTNF